MPSKLLLPEIQPVQNRLFINELKPVTADLLAHHLEVTKTWEPQEDIPFSNARDFYKEPYSDDDNPLAYATRVAILVNLLTEDNLPYYTHELKTQLPKDIEGEHPFDIWSGKWTEEEWKHGVAIRLWILAARAIDPSLLERLRRAQMSTGNVPHAGNWIESLAYTSFQELATQVAHRNTMATIKVDTKTLSISDNKKRKINHNNSKGRKVFSRVSGDEGLHYEFYAGSAAGGFELDPSTMMIAVARQLRKFKMPGQGIPGFKDMEKVIAASGIFGTMQYLEGVVKPTLEKWDVDAVAEKGLNSGGEKAYELILDTVAGLGRLANRQAEQQAEGPVRAGNAQT